MYGGGRVLGSFSAGGEQVRKENVIVKRQAGGLAVGYVIGILDEWLQSTAPRLVKATLAICFCTAVVFDLKGVVLSFFIFCHF